MGLSLVHFRLSVNEYNSRVVHMLIKDVIYH
jgi:hypothetical protein